LRVRLLFAHGWALDRTLWNGVLDALGDLAKDAAVLDAGYYGAPQGLPYQEGTAWLGVGQSLGALELLADPPAPLCGLVAIDGFARFAAAADFPAGQDPRRIQLMVKRLDHGPGPLVADFLGRALRGMSPAAGEPDPQSLARGLERLTRLDGRAAARRLPVWRLHACEDPIAPLGLADASFEGVPTRLRLLRQAQDHLSPITAPGECAALVRAAVQAIAE